MREPMKATSVDIVFAPCNRQQRMENHDSQGVQSSSESSGSFACHFPNTAELLRRREEAAGEVVAKGKRSGKHMRAQLELKMQERLKDAEMRRQKLLQERAEARAAVEQHRKEKLAEVKKLRKVALQTFIQQAPALLQRLSLAGLGLPPGDPSPSSPLVEHALLSDPWSCDHCMGKPELHNRICPVTGKPHRRSLVVLAEKLLKFIGDTRVNLVPRGDAVGEAAVAKAHARPRRGISVNPHLFVVAFFLASTGQTFEMETEQDHLQRECALQLVEIIEEVRNLVSAERGRIDENTVEASLQKFAHAWRHFVRIMESNLPSDREAAKEELIATTAEAYLGELGRILDSEDKDAKESEPQSPLLHSLRLRLHRIGGTQAVAKLEGDIQTLRKKKESNCSPPTNVDAAEAPKSVSPERSPELRPAAPEQIMPPAPLPSCYTSGSDSDVASVPRERRTPMGPPLPPQWFVDDQGISRPPPPQVQQFERRKQLEFRAASAFRSRVQIRTSNAFVDQAQEIAGALHEAQTEAAWKAFAEELSSSPPNVSRVPKLLDMVRDSLVESLPRRLRARVSQELRDVLDWRLVRYKLNDTRTLAGLVDYVAAKVAELGAPIRAPQIRSEASELRQRLVNATDSPSVVVPQIFIFLLKIIGQLKKDIAEFSLASIGPQLAAHAVEYRREFYQECMPPPAEWQSSKKWLEHLQLPPECSTAIGSPEWQKSTFSCVVSGILSLLQSANTTSDTRWAFFPEELLHFEKPLLFSVANLVQQCTLRLMVTGTVAMVLGGQQYRPVAADISAFVEELDRLLANAWLKSDGVTTLDGLKGKLVEETDAFLWRRCETQAEAGSPHAKPGAKQLCDVDKAILCGVVDKMIDTSSSQYVLFEARVSRAINCEVRVALQLSQDVSNVKLSNKAVQNDVSLAACDLANMLSHHWESSVPYYEALLR